MEDHLVAAVGWLRLGVDFLGAAIVTLGVLLAAAGFVRGLRRGQGAEFTTVRLTLGRFLSLALEFQLGADILSTAIAPGWDQIGKLGAIAVIRTTLNYFLTQELREAGHPVLSRATELPASRTLE